MLQVLSKHGLPQSSPKTTIREYLHSTAPWDLEFVYGLNAPAGGGPSSRTRGRKGPAKDDGSGTDEEGGDNRAERYEEEEEYDLMHDDVGKSKMPKMKM